MLGRGTRPHSTIASALGSAETPLERKAIIDACPKPNVLVLDFVGNCGRHKLVTSFDILGQCGSDKYDEEEIKRAKKISADAERMGETILTDEALKKAREELQAKKRAEAARRANLKASARFTVNDVDPFSIFGIPRPKQHGWNRVKKTTDKMLNALLRFGVPNAEDLNFTEAQAILSECIRRANSHAPTLKQEALLKKLGVFYPVRTFDEASRLIDQKMKERRK
jgi:hypothetical protein